MVEKSGKERYCYGSGGGGVEEKSDGDGLLLLWLFGECDGDGGRRKLWKGASTSMIVWRSVMEVMVDESNGEAVYLCNLSGGGGWW